MTDNERERIEELLIELILQLLNEKGKTGAPIKESEKWAER